MEMLSAHSRLLLSSNPQRFPGLCRTTKKDLHSFSLGRNHGLQKGRSWLDSLRIAMVSSSAGSPWTDAEIDRFSAVANKMADAAGEVIRKYFRQSFTILDKDDLSPVTIADRDAEESMCSIIMENFPTHAIFGEESGWRCKANYADYVWVLDPIDGTKSFITGKPLFGTLIALLYKGKPIVGIIDQPILKERWLGIEGKTTTLNGQEVSTRNCSKLSQAYLYTTSPHLFNGEAEMAFSRLRNKVKVPLYGCDCYAYALLASGFVDLVVESGLKVPGFYILRKHSRKLNRSDRRSWGIYNRLERKQASLDAIPQLVHYKFQCRGNWRSRVAHAGIGSSTMAMNYTSQEDNIRKSCFLLDSSAPTRSYIACSEQVAYQ